MTTPYLFERLAVLQIGMAIAQKDREGRDMKPIDLTALRHEFHKAPEPDFQEERTKARVADMDALQITEASAHDYVSRTDGVMHACGHDGHMSMLLGAAQELASDDGFDGTVVFIFQPSEEHGLGAQAMIKEGLLERFPMEEVYGIHNLPGAPLGQVSTRVGHGGFSHRIH